MFKQLNASEKDNKKKILFFSETVWRMQTYSTFPVRVLRLIRLFFFLCRKICLARFPMHLHIRVQIVVFLLEHPFPFRCPAPSHWSRSCSTSTQTTGAGGRLRYGMSTADTAPTDLRFSSGVVEPESQPSSNSSSRPGSSHGGAEGSFVAAPPSGRPTRAGVRRNKTPDGRENPANPRRKDEKAVRQCFLKCLSNYQV